MSKLKSTPFDNLSNEIAREKFNALRRISDNFFGCLKQLRELNCKIDEAIEKNLTHKEINKLIKTFNLIREDAKEWRYYLLVTREACGFFHSSLKSNVYEVPPQKSIIGVDKARL